MVTSDSSPPVKQNPVFSKYLPALSLVLMGVGMANLSWMRWPDYLVDFDRQLYIPWRLSEGDVLYRDVIYMFGPLSQYIHGGLFKLFGTHILTLVIFNIGLIVLMTILIHHLFSRFADALTAWVCSAVFILVFAFGQYVWIGNYNFVCSYAYEITHGVILMFGFFYFLDRYMIRKKSIHLGACGLMLGLIFLTKIEICLAAYLSAGLGLGILFWMEVRKGARLFPKLAILFSAMLAPPLLFILYFSFTMSVGDAFHVLISPWLLVNNNPWQFPFYSNLSGIDNISGNLQAIVGVSALYGIIVAAALALNHQLKNPRLKAAGCVVCGLIALLIFYTIKVPNSDTFAKVLPVGLLLATVWNLKVLIQKMNAKEAYEASLRALVFSSFALVLLSKMGINPRIAHYGFVLALPGTLWLIKVLLYDFRRWASRKSGQVAVFQFAMLTVVFVFVVSHLIISTQIYSRKSMPLAWGDEYILDFRHKRVGVVGLALEFIEDQLKPGEPFLVLPNGSILNYLSRRPNPIRYLTVSPLRDIFFGQAEAIRELEENPPTYILFMHRNYEELGGTFFGKDFGKDVYAWVRERYQSQVTLGGSPFAENDFGIEVLKRKP